MLWKLRLFWYRLDKAAFACALFFAFVVGVLATAAAAVFNHRDAQHAAVRQLLEDEVVRALHAGGAIRRLRAPVGSLYVQAEAAHGALLGRERLKGTIQPLVDAAPAVLGAHVDALDPPEVAVSPVAPFLRDH